MHPTSPTLRAATSPSVLRMTSQLQPFSTRLELPDVVEAVSMIFGDISSAEMRHQPGHIHGNAGVVILSGVANGLKL